MIAQAKILRVLKLISILKSRSKTIAQIASTLEITGRSVYRYLDLLSEVGFLVDKDFDDRYFIHTEEEEKSSFNFSSEESALLKDLISAGANNHPLKEAMLKKLYLNSDLKSLSKNLEKARLGSLVRKIRDGIEMQKQIVLKSYHSANSNEIKDRLVEPLTIGELYDEVIAFDTADGKVKHFKLERIGDVVMLNRSWKRPSGISGMKSDIFGIDGATETWVKLKLNLRSYLLLREEFPKSYPFLKKGNDEIIFHGPVRSFTGIGRFVLGLMDSVEIIGPPKFKNHIREKCQLMLENL